jgi:L-fuconolactonase
VQRRGLLKSAASFAVGAAARPLLQALDTSTPVIDAHIHLYDPTRPGGIPWPEENEVALYHPSLPSRYAQLARPHSVVGAIAVECSPWLVDNFWLQDVVEQNPLMIGFIGNLLPENPDFATTLDRLHRSPLFLGIRYGNLWNRDLGVAIQKPQFVSGLKLLAQAGLVLETANQDSALISATLNVADRVPDLRIVIDHLPHADLPADALARTKYYFNLRELSTRPNIFVKASEILRRTNGRVNLDAEFYKAQLDQLWDLFGDNHIIFGSDWPNSDSLASFQETFGVAQQYIERKNASAQEKFFWKNSVAAYNWRPRTANQAQLRS